MTQPRKPITLTPPEMTPLQKAIEDFFESFVIDAAGHPPEVWEAIRNPTLPLDVSDDEVILILRQMTGAMHQVVSRLAREIDQRTPAQPEE